MTVTRYGSVRGNAGYSTAFPFLPIIAPYFSSTSYPISPGFPWRGQNNVAMVGHWRERPWFLLVSLISRMTRVRTGNSSHSKGWKMMRDRPHDKGSGSNRIRGSGQIRSVLRGELQ